MPLWLFLTILFVVPAVEASLFYGLLNAGLKGGMQAYAGSVIRFLFLGLALGLPVWGVWGVRLRAWTPERFRLCVATSALLLWVVVMAVRMTSQPTV